MSNPETPYKYNRSDYPSLGIPSAKAMREIAERESNNWNDATRIALEIISESIKQKASQGYCSYEIKHSSYHANVKWHLVEQVLKDNEYKLSHREEHELITLVCW